MDNNSQKRRATSIAINAIVAVLGLLGVVAITIVAIPLQQEAEARGCPINTAGINASKGLCFHL